VIQIIHIMNPNFRPRTSKSEIPKDSFRVELCLATVRCIASIDVVGPVNEIFESGHLE